MNDLTVYSRDNYEMVIRNININDFDIFGKVNVIHYVDMYFTELRSRLNIYAQCYNTDIRHMNNTQRKFSNYISFNEFMDLLLLTFYNSKYKKVKYNNLNISDIKLLKSNSEYIETKINNAIKSSNLLQYNIRIKGGIYEEEL
jgi:hypothetical protein